MGDWDTLLKITILMYMSMIQWSCQSTQIQHGLGHENQNM